MDMYRSAPTDVKGSSRLSGLPVVKALFSCEAATASALSPVTHLSLNMNKLKGLGSQCETPKRILQDSYSMQRTDSSESMDAGLGLESPSAMNLKDLEETFEKALFDSGQSTNTKLPLGRRRSLPQKFLGSSPAFKRNLLHSLDCEVFAHGDENKENEPFQFKIPPRPSFRSFTQPQCHGEGKEVFVQRQKSAPACILSSPGKISESRGCDLALVRKSSCTSTTTESSDDGFLDMLDGDDQETDAEIPCGVASLWTAPLVLNRPEFCHEAGSPSITPVGRHATKRSETSHEDMPEKVKRRRSMFEVTEVHEPEKGTCLMQSKSFPETIESIFDSGQRDLIGDFSKAFLFPTVSGKHEELKYITPEMMVMILNGQFESLIEHCVVIDCRYPYEYEGGHIQGAINLYMEQEVENHLLKNPIQPHRSKRVIIIFHCEFSSERGPRICKFVRGKDRDMNEYPQLHYPELYILLGGYKDFFHKYKSLCDPEGYRPMHHEDFKDDFRKCRMKSRTWAGEKSKRELYSRLKKL
ncbi:M-phase inducer phosphatase 1 [Eleutherodactylus coqui]|uniref:M-phase inducer phosphatase 1 n=1 Tax=Eleutherodactylus coqui TaxID=57060 RepID=UPI0034624A65